jgi:cyclase
MRRPLILTAVIGVGLCAIAISAELVRLPQNSEVPNFGPVTKIEKMADNLYFVPGGGGNTAVFVHDNGVLLVDTKVPKNGQPLIDVVKSVTNKPITHIVNTHTHFDHAGSNTEFPVNVEIVTHENTKKYLAASDAYQSDAAKAFLPDKTFSDRMTLLSGKDAVDLYYYGAAHTGGDIFIVFRDDRVMHAGDVFPQPGGMLIDRKNGGSALAAPTTISRAVDGIKNVDRVITGHASVVGWDTFVDYRDFHKLALEHAQAQFAAGKTAEQALAAFNPPEKFKSWRYGQPSATPPPANLPAGVRAAVPGGYFASIYAELTR